MKRPVFVVASLASLLAQASPSRAETPVSMAKLRYHTDDKAFIFDIVQSNPRANYTLRIGCTEGCAVPIYYQEEVGDTPVGINIFSDRDELLVTTWTSGDSYHVKIYQFKKGPVRKVLDDYSLSPPALEWRSNTTAVVLRHFASQRSLHEIDITKCWVNERFSPCAAR